MRRPKKHPWKICPIGSIYVKSHYKLINGRKHYWKAHCRRVNSKKFILNKDEIEHIATNFSNGVPKLPKSYSFNVRNGNQYDRLIAGWVKFWSEVFNINSKIDSDFVKVLMMSESTFGKTAVASIHNRPGQAIGLLQITDFTLGLIQESSRELRNHSFKILREDLFDPNINIAVAVRWLYRKRVIAKYYLKKEPTALQLAEEYKGIRGDRSAKAAKQRSTFSKLLKEYKSAK